MNIKENEKLPKDHKLAKEAKSMTTGVTPNKLESGTTIDLHGHPVKITHTDDTDTTVQYANLARRTFETHILNSFLDLKTFPVGAAFERPTVYRNERAIIEAVTGDCCYQVRIVAGSDMPRHETFTYAGFIAWHMDNNAAACAPLQSSESSTLLDKIDNEIAKLDAMPDVMDSEPEEDLNPYEADLKTRIAQLEADLAAAEINGQTRINELMVENRSLNADLLKQHDLHVTEFLAKNERIARLEEKAAILAPICKEHCIKHDINKADLDKLSSEGWQLHHTQFAPDGKLNVLFIRDLPAAPAPQMLATDAAIYGTPAYSTYNPPPIVRPPVQRPPMPANQTIIHQPLASRPLTHNVSRITGATKRIPTLADIEARREKDNAEIEAIMQRGLAEQEVLRRKFAQSPSPFNMTGAQ